MAPGRTELLRGNASATYGFRLKMAQGDIDALRHYLALHAMRQRARPDDWGFPGDLANLLDKLAEARAAIGGGLSRDEVRDVSPVAGEDK
jgi:hypothetical protein